MDNSFKIALSLSAFKTNLEESLLQTKSLGFEFCELIALENYGQIDIENLSEETNREIDRTGNALEKMQLKAAAITVSPGNLSSGESELLKIENRSLAICKMLKELDIPLASYYPGFFNGEQSGISWIEAFESLCRAAGLIQEIAESEALGLFPDPHFNTPLQHPQHLQLFCERFPELPLVYSPSHFSRQAITLKETCVLMDRAAHVHLRDTREGEKQCEFLKGELDFDYVLTYLRQKNYQGFVSIEYLAGPDAVKSIPEIKRYLEEFS